MDIICKLFDRAETDNIARSLGNMMISGVDNLGRNIAYSAIVRHQLIADRTLVILQDSVTAEKHRQLKALISACDKRIYDISLSESSDSRIDILSAFKRPEDKAGFIVMLLGYTSALDDTMKNRAYRYFYYAFDFLDRLESHYTLESLAELNLDQVLAMASDSSLDEAEKNRRTRFLSDPTTASAFVDIESFMLKLRSIGICRALSGEKTCNQLFSDGSVTIFSGFACEDRENSELFINAVAYALNHCIEVLPAAPISIILNNADFIKNDVVNSLMQYNSAKDIAVYLFIEDVSTYVGKNGNELIEKAKSFLVFTQGSDQNALFWSSFFGSRDVQERSYSYTKKRGLFSFGGRWNTGGVVAQQGKFNSTTTIFQRVNKPIYRPEIFRELRPLEVMCYLREPLIRRKSRIE